MLSIFYQDARSLAATQAKQLTYMDQVGDMMSDTVVDGETAAEIQVGKTSLTAKRDAMSTFNGKFYLQKVAQYRYVKLHVCKMLYAFSKSFKACCLPVQPGVHAVISLFDYSCHMIFLLMQRPLSVRLIVRLQLNHKSSVTNVCLAL